jgi:hypothetical protein
MRKILFFIVLLILCSTQSYEQNLSVKPSTPQTLKADEVQNLDYYLMKNQTTNTKALIWSSTMTDPSDWVAAKMPDQDASILNTWEWKADTSLLSPLFKQYVHPDSYMNSATCTSGLYYFDGITNLINQTYAISNSAISNSVGINTLGFNSVSIKFYQLYKSFNQDSSLLEISSDNVNWKTIDVNPNVAVNTYAYGWKELNITQWAANKAQVWIRFRFFGPASTSSGAQYGGGYGWAIDDVELFEPANNNVQVDRVTLYDGYMKIPSGLGRPMYYDGDFTNLGGKNQTHFKLHGVELTTAADSTSSDTTLIAGQSITGIELNNYFFTPPTTLGTYKVAAYISSDSIPHQVVQDTFDIKVVCDTCLYSRDNNTYVGSRWAGTTGTLCDPYTAANRFLVNQDRMMYGVNCVVNKETKPGSKIKAVLYKYFAATATRTIVAQSTNYYITAANIPTTSSLVDPPTISLHFPTGYTLQKDSIYYAGIEVFGGTDTVKIASDNTGIPQYTQTSLYFDPTANSWYIWASGGNVPAVMIRCCFNINYPFDNGSMGINEIPSSVTLFSCMPNPANFTTKISYELKNNENASIIITDITGRTVQTISQGHQNKGYYSVDVDLTSLTSGTYFYTLKTKSAQLTDKLIIVKR